MIKGNIKSILIFLLFITTFILIESCSNTTKKATEYYKKIYNCTEGIFKSEDTLIGTITNIRNLQSQQYIADKYIPDTNINISLHINNLDTIYKSFLFSIDSSNKALQGVSEFDGGKLLKNGAIELNSVYKKVAVNYYKQIIDIIKILPDNYTVEDDTRFQEISDTINIFLENEIEKFNKISEAFISYYGVELE